MRSCRAALAGLAMALAGCAGTPPRQAAVPACAPAPPAPPAFRFVAAEYDAGLPRAGQWRDGFDLSDMDGDGHVDLVHGAPRKSLGAPAIFLGDGRGGFRPWREAHFPPLPYDYGDAKAADLDNDGRQDLVLGVHLRGVVALLNEGGGHFAPWGEGLGLKAPEDSPMESVFGSRAIAVGDVDGNGRVDIVALNEGPALFAPHRLVPDAARLFLNRDRHWDTVRLAPGVAGFGDSLLVDELDGDGRLDIVLGTQASGEQRLVLRGASLPRAEPLEGLPPDATVTAVARRGRDVVLATRAVAAGEFCVALMQWRGRAAQPAWSEPSRDPIVALASADLDGDGHDDVVAGRSSGSMQLFSGAADHVTRDVAIARPASMEGCQLYDLRLADLDSDGAFELLASYAGDDPGYDGRGCPSQGGILAWRVKASS